MCSFGRHSSDAKPVLDSMAIQNDGAAVATSSPRPPLSNFLENAAFGTEFVRLDYYPPERMVATPVVLESDFYDHYYKLKGIQSFISESAS